MVNSTLIMTVSVLIVIFAIGATFIFYPGPADEQLMIMARDNLDATYCTKMVNVDVKNNCLQTVFAIKSNLGTKANVKTLVDAAVTRNVSGCDSLNESMKDRCLDTVYYETIKDNITNIYMCNPLRTESKKSMCMDLAYMYISSTTHDVSVCVNVKNNFRKSECMRVGGPS